MELRFAKYEGLGNDFIVVDDLDVTAEQAAALCDRHLGIGADGVLVVRAGGDAAPSMHVINADGSIPEMCGNGLRCVALHLARTGKLEGREVTVETAAGPHACRVLPDGRVAVQMTVPTLDPARIPVRASAPLIDAAFEIDGATLRITAVSMGNPHAVTFDDVGDARHSLGPRIERDARFPERVNVGFARIDPSGAIDLSVWERGAGWTRACGTGACAAAVAAVTTGRARRDTPIEVRLPGGPLEIVVGREANPVQMTGPARHVFDGTIALHPQ